ncbi:MAG: hypothetical protein ACFB0C_01260 [Leptolyngbyaceae cyanobacterium]
MSTPSVLERARAGEADAIATLINRNLHSQGLQVQATRDAYHLTLWVTSASSPPPETVAAYICQGIEKLNISSIGILIVIGQIAGQSVSCWRHEFSLLAAYAQGADSGEVREEDQGSESLNQAKSSVERFLGGPAEDRASIETAYRTLQLPLGASLSEVDAAYFKQKSLLLKQGNRELLPALKAAHDTLKTGLQAQQAQQEIAQDIHSPEGTPSEFLKVLFRQNGLPARIKFQAGHLEIQLPAHQKERPHRVVARIHKLLTQAGRAVLNTTEVDAVTVYGLNERQKVVWRRSFKGSQLRLADHDTDLLSFQNRHSNTVIFPALMALAILMNGVPLVSALLFGVKIWFHEFGHATVAWLAGRKAIPLPIGWTNVQPERSLFVYLGLLILLGLLYWSGRREQRRWPMILAVVLAPLQFGMTWLMPIDTFEVLLNFGGIGGEFYLCTLLMVSFYFPLPAYWRWDFYRYPVVLGAAFTFWGQLWLWKQIAWGQATIPWGSLWGGAEHGDMNNLALYGWSPQRITDTYNSLGNVCFAIVLGVYVYFVLKHYRPALFIQQR